MVRLQFTCCYCLCNLLFDVLFCEAYPASSFWVSIVFYLRDSKKKKILFERVIVVVSTRLGRNKLVQHFA